MSRSQPEATPKAVYVRVDTVESRVSQGHSRTSRKRLLESESLEIDQTRIAGSADGEDYGVCATIRLAYVLQGRGVLRVDDADSSFGKGDLVVVPAGVRWGQQLSVQSDELVMLEIAPRTGAGEADASGVRPDASIRVVRPGDVQPYEPAGHAKTTNRCLFVDNQLEVIQGFIDRGGGADRHFHERNEQALYVLNAPDPLLIHYPRCTPHGTGGGITDPLELLVIYSPPLGESQNALG